MARIPKRVKQFASLYDRAKAYPLKDAICILKKAPKVKFDETVEIAAHLNIDPKQTSQAVRGTVALPHGTGKKVRIAAFCKGEEERKAREAGAEYVGAEDLIAKVQGGWCDFDVAVATPDMMKDLAKLGKILGPRGLMPNPKAGTVTQDMTKAIKELQAGRIEFKMDKQAGIHAPIGKLSFSEEAIYENSRTLIEAILDSNPQGARGQHVKTMHISTTMGPGVKLDLVEFKEA
jgi:large subunit ribosomal protein L1